MARAMEFILVSSVKLKIMLSPQDMKDFGLSERTADGTVSEKRSLRKILDRAQAETGFDTKNATLYVQAFPAPDGSMELFLTRRSRLLPEPEEQKSPFRKKYRFSGDDRGRRKYIAVSHDIDPLADLCVRMNKEGFRGSSVLYMFSTHYYLFLEFPRRFPQYLQNEPEDFTIDEAARFFYLSEYADVAFADGLTLAALSEHGKTLIEQNAVETLARAFSGT